MPPTGVWISTFLSWPRSSFFTLTLHAGRSRSAMSASAQTSIGVLLSRRFRGMWKLSCGLCRTVDAGAALRDVRNADGEASPDGDFSEQGLDRTYFRYTRVRE